MLDARIDAAVAATEGFLLEAYRALEAAGFALDLLHLRVVAPDPTRIPNGFMTSCRPPERGSAHQALAWQTAWTQAVSILEERALPVFSQLRADIPGVHTTIGSLDIQLAYRAGRTLEFMLRLNGAAHSMYRIPDTMIA